jgi:ATP-dependent DNA helicase RecG
MTPQSIFLSSVQKELADERRAVKAFVEGDPLLRRFFTVFLFEDLPARDRRTDEVYLAEVDRCALYVGLFDQSYGFEDAEGVSPTEREFDRATSQGKARLIFVKGTDDKGRHPKMQALIRRAGAQLIRRRFGSMPELTAALYASLVEHLERHGVLRTGPFDASACPGATLKDLSEEKLRGFLRTARHERGYALAESTPVHQALAHLNLLDHGHPSRAAVLLFGTNPQRFLTTSEVKCLHFHGTEVRKPIPSHQIYKGTVFEVVDQAVDFVLSKIARSVGTRSAGTQAPVEYELPRDAVTEAIVNAVAHRDYAGNASVQVMLFADRLEIWNPGELPAPLTPELLRSAHASIPRNPLLAEPLFLARYIEKAGTGTLDMIALCREAGLPEPEFRQDGGQFVQTLWRDWLTARAVAGLQLNTRQLKAVGFLRLHRRITNKEYRETTSASDRTALRDLAEMLEKGVLAKRGQTGRSAHYVLASQPAMNPTNPPLPPTGGNTPQSRQTRHEAHPSGSQASSKTKARQGGSKGNKGITPRLVRRRRSRRTKGSKNS